MFASRASRSVKVASAVASLPMIICIRTHQPHTSLWSDQCRQLLWRPYEAADTTPSSNSSKSTLEAFSDHMFLLRKGIPVQSTSFNVGAQSVGFGDEGCTNNNVNEEHMDVGRGYDLTIPSVFKAKVPGTSINTSCCYRWTAYCTNCSVVGRYSLVKLLPTSIGT